MSANTSSSVGLSANGSALCNGLLNPFTPMAFLPPGAAFQAQLAEFVIACSLAVLIWDQLHTLSDDYTLAFKKQFRWPTAVYFISRISTIADLVVKNVQLNSQTNHCESMRLALCFLLAFSRASTAFLMYIRVCAVYNMNKFIVVFFGLTWLMTVAGATTTFTAMEAMYIGSTKYCTSMVKSDYLIVMSITDFINDTSILVAIMYKLGMAGGIRRNPTSQLSSARTPTSRLQRFTRVFLQDSQIYYTITVVFSFATIITFFAVRTPHAPFRFTMIHPTAAIVNIMACRVFRNIKLSKYSQDIALPAHLDGGNVTQQDSKPIINGENSYHTSEMDAPTSEFSQRKDSWRFPITSSHRLGMETPNSRFGGVEVTKVIELVRD